MRRLRIIFAGVVTATLPLPTLLVALHGCWRCHAFLVAHVLMAIAAWTRMAFDAPPFSYPGKHRKT